MTTEEDVMNENKEEHPTRTGNNSESTPTENQYFYEDLVFRIRDKKVSFGMVVENNEDDDSQSLAKGHVVVSWYPQGWNESIKEKNVGLADRSLMPGDVVRRMVPTKSKDVQHGYCRDINVSAAVQQVGTRNVIANVSNDRFVPLDRFPLDLIACLRSWVGSIKEHQVMLKLVMFANNPSPEMANSNTVVARLEFVHNDVCDLKTAEKRKWMGSYESCEHYVGQVLTIVPCNLTQARWTLGSRELQLSRRQHKFTVESLETISVGVYWQCQGLVDGNEGDTLTSTRPDYLIMGNELQELKILNVFETCTSQIGDRNYLTINESDVFETKAKWLKRQSKIYRGVQKRSDIPFHTSEIQNGENAVPLEDATDCVVNVTDDEEWSTDETDDSSSLTNSCSSSVATCGSGRVTPVQRIPTPTPAGGKKSPVLSTKVLKRKLKKERRSRPAVKAAGKNAEPPKPGQAALVETLCTSSTATVVWQDGTVEVGIPSTHLYPIHHLDYQEFFPGDFVIRGGSADSQDIRDYGVVQYMNHAARTAVVKWFRTYASPAPNTIPKEPSSPSIHGETEMSVYDLKDHPAFDFRPGSVVIRIAGGYSNETVKSPSTAGQVLDNYPDGKVNVRWVTNTTSMCWPQDLYRVGDYDSDEGELWDDDGDSLADDSWETQSEESLAGDASFSNEISLRPRLAANIERSCEAMARLEDMFTQNPALQSREVMRKLLEVYKDCRYLDRLMETTIFHEQHFTALLERVKARDSRSTVTQRIERQMQRLFSAEGPLSDLDSTIQTYSTSEPKKIETFSGQTDLDAEIVRTSAEALTKSSSVHCSDTSVPLLASAQEIVNELDGENKFIRSTLDNWCTASESTVTSISKTAEILTNIVNVQDAVKIEFDKTISTADNNVRSEEGIGLENKEGHMTVCVSSPNANVVTMLYRVLSPDTRTEGSNTMQDSGVASAPNTSDSSSDSVEGDRASNTLHSPQSPTSSQPLSIVENGNACKELCALIKSRLIIAHAEVLKRLGTSEVINMLRNEADDDEDVTEDDIKTSTDTEPPNKSEDSQEAEEEINTGEGFLMLEHAPVSHRYHLSIVQPPESQSWIKAVRKELRLLERALPPGVWVRGYEDRLDILSVMIRGPAGTPYEDGLFLFDIQLGPIYPLSPPHFHYISFCSDRLNPNLYEDGKVCVSLLGTWTGRGSEVWGPTSTLLQVIVSVQGLILNSEPYYNEAGYERQRGSNLGQENSRMYNEMVTLKLVQSMTKLLQNPPEVFKEEIYTHFKQRAKFLYKRLEELLVCTEEHNNMKTSASQISIGTTTDLSDDTEVKDNKVNKNTETNTSTVEQEAESSTVDIQISRKISGFPLIPASKGFCLSMRSALPVFKDVLNRLNLIDAKT